MAAQPTIPASVRPDSALAACALDGSGAVSPEAWDECVAPGSGPLKHGYLRAWEKSELRGLESRPVVAYRDGSPHPVAICPAHLYDLDIATVRSPGSSGPVRAIRHLWDSFLFARTYELGSPTPLTNPFLVSEPELRPQAVATLIEVALEEAESREAEFVLVQNFTSREGPVAEELAGRGFAGVPILPTATIDLPYESFDDYLGAMRSQYRRRARQALERSAHLEVRHLREFEDEADELARLWSLVHDRATEVKREILTPEFFRAVSSVEDVSVLALRREDGSIASFGLLLSDHPWLFFLQTGFSEEAGREEAAYFRLLYEIVRFGIENEFEQADFGMTTLEPKLDVGAVPVPLYAWVRHQNAAFRRIIRGLAAGPMKPPEVEPRHVFKEAPPTAAELVARRPTPA